MQISFSAQPAYSNPLKNDQLSPNPLFGNKAVNKAGTDMIQLAKSPALRFSGKSADGGIATPRQIADEMKNYVLHQDTAVERIALAVYRHVKRGLKAMAEKQTEDPQVLSEAGVKEDEFSARLKELKDNPPTLTAEMIEDAVNEFFWVNTTLSSKADDYQSALEIFTKGVANLIASAVEDGEVSEQAVSLWKEAVTGMVDDSEVGLHNPYNEGVLHDGHTYHYGFSFEEVLDVALNEIIRDAQLNLGNALEKHHAQIARVESERNQFLYDNVVQGMRDTIASGGEAVLLEKPQEPAKKEKEFTLADPKDGELGKSNILMLGDTGSGKTHIARQAYKVAAQTLDVPFVDYGASNLTEAGYKGGNIEDLGVLLLTKADGDVEKAENGIVFLDELDKKKRKSNGGNRDVSGEGAQDNLLTILEGGKLTCEYNGDQVTLNTENILFITAGAFDGLDEIIKKRVGGDRLIGFGTQSHQADLTRAELLQLVIPEDLVEYGLKPELVGRLPVIAPLVPSTVDVLKDILTKPNDALIKKHINNARDEGVELEFTDGAITAIAEKASEYGTGARALQSIVDAVTFPLSMEMPELPEGSKITVTAETVENPQMFTVQAADDNQKKVLNLFA